MGEESWYNNLINIDDFPRASVMLKDFEAIVGLKLDDAQAEARLHVLAVRIGIGWNDGTGHALRAPERGIDFRSPGSAHYAETGTDDAGGKSEKEMLAALRAHLARYPDVDIVVAQSRGCRLLAALLEPTDDATEAVWSGPVLVLSPAGGPTKDLGWGAKIFSSPAAAVVVAVSEGDLSTGAVSDGDLAELRELGSGHDASRYLFEVDAPQHGRWRPDEAMGLLRRVVRMARDAREKMPIEESKVLLAT